MPNRMRVGMSGHGRGARYVVQWHDVQDNSVWYTCDISCAKHVATCACSIRIIDECSRPGPDGVQMNPGCARIWDIYNTLDSGLKACTCMTSEKDYTAPTILYTCVLHFTFVYLCTWESYSDLIISTKNIMLYTWMRQNIRRNHLNVIKIAQHEAI